MSIFCGANWDHLFHLHFLFLCFEAVSELKIDLVIQNVLLGAVDDVGDLACMLGS